MNKKIIISLSVIAAVAAVVIGGTISYFSDTETSTGNTFTAGSIDLKVDSTQHYNNAVCVNNAWALEPNKTADTPQYPVIGSACDGTWVAADLGAQKFFNFADIKPECYQ
jgi:predicted ribosomally synthesized peptide with SipW-like signal peptide